MSTPKLPHGAWPVVAWAVAAAMVLVNPAWADDEDPSITAAGFGTIGAARSDQPWRYQRFLRDELSFERDTVLGMQVDARVAERWSATVQAKLAPSANKDSSWSLTPAWVFVSWRPDNDWLVRAGKLRVPLFLRSEVLDVGQTYDEARLPAEVYSMSPTNDFNGLYLTRNLMVGDGELSVDVYSGSARTYKRTWIRNAVPSPVAGQPDLVSAGPLFRHVRISPTGVVLTWRDDRHMLRAGLHQMRIALNNEDAFTDKPVWAQLAPGVGYWQTSNLLPGPGVIKRTRFNEWLLLMSGEWTGKDGWRLAGDYGRVVQQHVHTAQDSWNAIATVYKAIGPFVPYASLAIVRSSDVSAQVVRELESTTVPASVPGADLLNAAMRAQVDATLVYRQHSLAVGSSYALSPKSKLKFEWMHGRLVMTTLADLPAGEPLERGRSVNVLSASYNFVF
jgi:hypothetical protein